jgi:hypothetical protein
MKRIFIHIGMGRCGSSSIQLALANNRENLFKNKILYPEINTDETAQHVLGLLRKDQVCVAIQAWKTVINEFKNSECSTLLLSTENFIGVSDELFDAIRSLTDNYLVNIIFVTRNQRELLPSIYAHWTKAGIAFKSFDHFFRVTRQEWCFAKIIKRWASAYGLGNVHCGVLCPGDDAVKVFALCCGDKNIGGILEKTEELRINASINSKLLVILNLFDRLHSPNIIGNIFPGWDRIEPTSPDRNESTRHKLVTILENFSKKWFKPSPWRISKKQELEIIQEYKDTNRLFHESCLGNNTDYWLK